MSNHLHETTMPKKTQPQTPPPAERLATLPRASWIYEQARPMKLTPREERIADAYARTGDLVAISKVYRVRAAVLLRILQIDPTTVPDDLIAEMNRASQGDDLYSNPVRTPSSRRYGLRPS